MAIAHLKKMTKQKKKKMNRGQSDSGWYFMVECEITQRKMGKYKFLEFAWIINENNGG